MLAAMVLALAHSQAAPAFNGLFYATAATIIPVLFLALAVQGTIYQDFLTAAVGAARSIGRGHRSRRYPSLTAVLTLGPIMMIALAGLIPIYGAAGELAAIYALAEQKSGLLAAGLVPGAVIVLAAATAAGPLMALFRAMVDTVIESSPRGGRRRARDRQSQRSREMPNRRLSSQKTQPRGKSLPKWAKRASV
jgi:hypothetical protein